jgi:hypothetical protein
MMEHLLQGDKKSRHQHKSFYKPLERQRSLFSGKFYKSARVSDILQVEGGEQSCNTLMR